MPMNRICLATLNRIFRIAAPVAALTIGAHAHAQSTVQLYGIVDAWAGYQRVPSNPGAAQLGGGGLSTSFWGFGGQEDLGGGYKAVFAIEGFFRPQNGRFGSFDGDPTFSRNAYVGIASPYGALALGRQSSLLYLQSAKFNPFYASFTFSPTIVQLYASLGTYPGFPTDQGIPGGTSWSNAIQYSTPDLGGLSGAAMYAPGNEPGENGAKKFAAQAQFARGALALGAVYQYLNFSAAPGDLGKLLKGFRSQTTAQLGASYDLRIVKLFGEYTYVANTLAGSNFHVNMLQGGVTIPVGIGRILASYAYSRDNSALDQARSTASISYDYPLSKRTDVYAGYLYDRVSNLSTGCTYGAGIRTRF
ncbi:porin [Burkholderia lata]|uniref:Porin n=2 Tax=Burkholderia lata (strain ATCC 17760 / DSM 23089 / LMG 22485 / NCIMB 9086 / R18194 / 383) TaxID=482957 RepID=A0A6P2P6Z9_BURL3|nr:porin [Burkholderia lata]VWC03715.1 porin [Burkholderia lata]